MIGRLLTGGLTRAIMVLGISFFAVYGLIAVVLGKTGHGDAQAVTAAIMGYLFIVGIAALWLYERRRLQKPGPVTQEFLGKSHEVAEMVGAPVTVTIPNMPEVGKGPGQITVEAFISGPEGSGEATVVLARLAKGFQVLGADLDVAGAHRSVTAGYRPGG
jgi:hypothetical protein